MVTVRAVSQWDPLAGTAAIIDTASCACWTPSRESVNCKKKLSLFPCDPGGGAALVTFDDGGSGKTGSNADDVLGRESRKVGALLSIGASYEGGGDHPIGLIEKLLVGSVPHGAFLGHE